MNLRKTTETPSPVAPPAQTRTRRTLLFFAVAVTALLLAGLAQRAGWLIPNKLEAPVASRAPAGGGGSVAALPASADSPVAPRRTSSERTDDERQYLLEFLRRRLELSDALPNQAVLQFRSPAALSAFLRRADAGGLPILGRIDALSLVRLGYDRVEQLRDALAADPSACADVGVNFLVLVPDVLQTEDRPAGAGMASYQGLGFLSAIGADADRSAWGQGVTIAVVDTGVEDHPTFAPGQVVHYDLVNDDQPFDGHGTAMASLIAGQSGAAPGVAPASQILDVRVADSLGYSDTFTVAAGIVQAADAGAQVINISLGSYGDSQAVREAVAYAESKGAVIVSSAGNEQTTDQLTFPAAIATVISVGGIDARGQQAYFANSGSGLVIAAPAVGIQSAYGQHFLIVGDGTSQAAAITSGVVAYGIAGKLTSHATAADWLRKNAQPLALPPERAGAGQVHIPAVP